MKIEASKYYRSGMGHIIYISDNPSSGLPYIDQNGCLYDRNGVNDREIKFKNIVSEVTYEKR